MFTRLLAPFGKALVAGLGVAQDKHTQAVAPG